MADPVEVLDFWLGEVGPEGWYVADAALDATCRDRFLDLWRAAHADGLEHWVEGTVGSLAYLILCDQLSRNIHRGRADAHATDARALAAARRALANTWDMNAPEPERQFFYMPFTHSENPDDQALAVDLMATRLASAPEMALHARAHQQVVARFGRFPARNAYLARLSTAEEVDFLSNGGYAALISALKLSHATGA